MQLLFVVIVSFLHACSKDGADIMSVNPSSQERGALISYQQKASLTAQEISTNGSTIGDVSGFALNDIITYRVVYNSLYDGALVQVSGLVMIPKNVSNPLRLIQHHHGTIIPFAGSEREVPSNYNGGIREDDVETSFIGAVMAANGYVVSLPDYVGYGETSHLEHPYTVHHELAEVSVDMIRATKNLLNELAMPVSDEVFLTGWSEGGGAGLATHKYVQLHYSGEFDIRGSSVLAGPYDYATFFSDVISNNAKTWDNLSIYSWGAYALNKFTPSLQKPKDGIWTYDVTDQADALNVPSNVPNEIFETTFIEGFTSSTNSDFREAAQANSLVEGWTPVGNLFFHSGTADAIVPHYNSVNAHQQFEAMGANSTLYEYRGGDHYSPLYDYVTTTLTDFNTL